MQEIKFKIYTLGCKVNQYDSKDLSKKLIVNGFKLAKKMLNWPSLILALLQRQQ